MCQLFAKTLLNLIIFNVEQKEGSFLQVTEESSELRIIGNSNNIFHKIRFEGQSMDLIMNSTKNVLTKM